MINPREAWKKRKPSYTAVENVNRYSLLWRTVLRFLKNLETEITYNTTILAPMPIYRKTII